MDHASLHAAAATPRTSVAVVGRWYTAIHGQMDVTYTRRPRVGTIWTWSVGGTGRDCIAVACYVRQWITWTKRSEQNQTTADIWNHEQISKVLQF